MVRIAVRTERTLGLLGVVSALGAAAAAAPAAAAPQLSVDRECYHPRQAIELTGAGYTPGGNVRFSLALDGDHGKQLLISDPFTAAVNPPGVLRATLPAPQLASFEDRQEQLFVSATDETRVNANAPMAEQFGATSTLLSAVNVYVESFFQRKVRVGKLTRVRADGLGTLVDGRFTRGTLYAHYLRKKVLVKTVEVGKLAAPCGTFTGKMRQFPFEAQPGNYTVDFDMEKRYNPTAPGIRYKPVPVERSRNGRMASGARATRK